MTKKLKNPQPSAWQQYHTKKSEGVAPPVPTLAQPRGPAYPPAERATYTGAELAPYTGRPGSMQAYAIPSLVAGQPQPRKVPSCSPCAKQGPAK